MSEEHDHLTVPKFEPAIPPNLLHGKSESEKWMYNQTDIHGQQNKWIIERLLHMDDWRHDVGFARTLRKLFGGVRGAFTGVFALLAATVLAEILLHFLKLK